MQKNARKLIRKTIFQQRSLLTSQQQRHASKLISQRVLRTLSFLACKRIAFYFASNGEVNTLDILEKALSLGKECYFPILHPIKHNQMWFGRYEAGDPLKKNCFGIYEPDLDIAEKIPPWSLDIVITPLVAFDHQGNRLGMGGGYYDRTFSFLQNRARHKPKLVGLAYEFQQLAQVPNEQWDVGLNMVITQSNIYHFISHGNRT